MSFKAIVFFALLAVTQAEKPYLGLRVPSLSSSPQVVGGKEAPEGAYPYIVSLQRGIFGLTSHFCAGSIINSEWILTAGHCVNAVSRLVKITVKAGKHNLKARESTEQIIKAAKTIVHEQYKGGVGPYDIALIKLKSPLSFTAAVQAIKLPEAESEPSGNATLCGWGSTSTSRLPKMPNKLQYVNLEYVDLSVCSEAVSRLAGSSPVHETNVCTGPLTGGISACSGDSGGPLTSCVDGEDQLTGIVSWGIIPCGTVGAPSVYTKVSAFKSWIDEKIANN
ncbi:trypsin [Linepithema humile]|uniref:trypsin n=1 Tax=Linepithema humile TaxID=83485 RepID=UPI0006234397|nr:PREDICTED: trypsin-like [Linepithema humile]